MAALVWPVTALTAVLLVAAWHLSVARLDVSTAAAAAARAASLQTSPATATTAADQAAQTALADAGRACAELTVHVDTLEFVPGGYVEVQLTCHVTTGDLIGLDAPGTVVTTATARAPLEQFRELAPDQP